VAAAAAAERAEADARFTAASATAASSGAPPPFRGPAADSPLGEQLLNVLPHAFALGFALDLRHTRYLCGLTLRERAILGGAVATRFGDGVLLERRAADGTRVVRLPWATLHTRDRIDERGFRGGTADTMARTLERQAPWIAAARAAPREDARISHDRAHVFARTTQLMRSVVDGDERRVSELLAAGAAPCSVNGDACTALHYAALNGRADITRLLCAVPGGAAALALRNKDGATPLMLAVSSSDGGEGLVTALLEADAAGVSVDAQIKGGYSALMWASEKGYEGAVRLLLARGARQELQNENGDTALHYAAWKGHAGVAKLLCAAPGAAAALTLRTEGGNMPLVIAIAEGGGGEGLVAAMLEADATGVSINAQEGGFTALMWASRKGYESAVRLLLAHGARQELQDERGYTALHFAAREGHVGVAELLCAAPGAAAALALRAKGGNTPLALAISEGSGSEDIVTVLLEADVAGVSVDALNKVGYSALTWASYKGYECAVRLLLARGARQELQDEDGYAALHNAARKGHVGIAELLCAAPGAAAALARRDQYGFTPLKLANSNSHTTCAAVLRAHGAKK
jgi:ankyrin repeat protein